MNAPFAAPPAIPVPERHRSAGLSVDARELFDAHDSTSDLKTQSVRAGVIVIGTQAIRFALTILSVSVLARLLTPTDFGVFAMAALPVAFLMMFQDFGLSMATIRQVRISPAQVNTLHWISVGIGAALAVVGIIAGPVVAWAFNDPQLIGITAVLSINLLLAGVPAQQLAMLQRALRFKTFTAIELGSLAVGIVVAIVAAMLGAGLWARVCLPLTISASRIICTWLICPWHPGRPAGAPGVRRLLKFGGNVTGTNVTTYLSRNIDRMFIGGLLGPTALGLYTKAYELMMLPVRQLNAPIATVAMPVLSRLQDSPERFRTYFRTGLTCAVAIALPIAIFMLVAADDLVLLVLGSQWAEAAHLLRLMAPLLLTSAVSFATSWVCIALCRANRQFRSGLVVAAGVVIAAPIGSHWGLSGVACAVAVSISVLRIPEMLYCLHDTPVRVQDVLSAIWRPAAAGVVAGAVLMGLNAGDAIGGGTIAGPVIAGLLFSATYAACWFVLPGGAASVREAVAMFRGDSNGGPA